MARTFVKKGKILFRLLPKNSEVYNNITAKGLNLIRFDNNNGILTNSVVIKDLIHNYYEADTLNWMKMFRRDSDKTGFVYSTLYPNNSNEKLEQLDKLKLEKMTFDMLLLSCDLDKEVAKACGLFVSDTLVNNNKHYTYKLSIYTNSLSAKYNELLRLNINASDISLNSQILDVKGSIKSNVVTLSWNALVKSNEFSGYNIYRSEDSTLFKAINNAPVILIRSQFEKNKQNIYYKDSLHEKNKKYFYYVKGINFFGEESDPSNIVTVYSAPVIRSFPIIDSLKVIENKKVFIHWRMDRSEENLLPEKYIVLKSNKDNGVYKMIYESRSNFKFIDSEPFSSGYYKIGAITNRGEDTIYSFSRMATIIDTIPPNVVLNCKASIDDKGILKITWSKNKESDILGYKVFRSNRKEDEFVQVNTNYISDTLFTEKLNLKTLSKYVYYRVVASDQNHNSSCFSDIIEVSRPDTIPPQAPVLVSVIQVKKSLVVKFIKSLSQDVSGHVLFKRTERNSNYEKILVLKKNDSLSVFIDTMLQQGKSYSYKLKAIDEDGNESESKQIEALYETGFRDRIKDINYSIDRTAKNIELKWSYNENDVEKYVIYRGKKSEPLTIIKSLKGENLFYVDKTVFMGNTYVYKIKATMKNGTESAISDPIIIEY